MMSLDGAPPIGLRHSRSLIVDAGLTVPEVSPAFGVFRDMPAVFASAYMLALVEATCIEALAPYLGKHQRTVGTHVDMSHTAATPVGMRVTAEIELIAIEGRRLRFRVECRDEADTIGSGFHERAVIELPKFTARVEAKRRALG
jgi:fluoroacetyl-CoA thioesterase